MSKSSGSRGSNNPRTFRVTPDGGGAWKLKVDGNTRATKIAPTQAELIKQAVQSAKREGGEVVVQGRDGKIRSKDSYGNDPNPPRDKEH